MSTFIRAFDAGGEYLEHRDGVNWYDAPLPHRWHRCRTQSRGYMLGGWCHRCPCGAISRDGRYWMERNSARKGTFTFASRLRSWLKGGAS